MPIELKPCPFCGGKATIYGSTTIDKYFAGCTRCTAAIGIYIDNKWHPTFYDREDAADAWNNRAESKGEADD